MINPEYCLLGIVLNNPNLFVNLKEGIFFNKNCIELYQVMSGEYKKSKGFTKETLLELIKDNPNLNEDIFYEIYDSAWDDKKFDQYYNYILSLWAIKKADISIKELRIQKYTGINEVKKALQDIVIELSVDDEKEIRSSKDIIFEIVEELGQKKEHNLIDSYCNYIDDYGGFEAGDLVVIAARPSTGKSTLMYNLLLKDMYNSISCGLFSMEAKEKKVYKIIGCIGAGINTQHMRTFQLTDIEKEILSSTYGRIYEKEILTIDRVNVDIYSLIRKAKIMKDQKNIKKLYIDYLQLLTCNVGKTRYEQMTTISRELKKLAMELDIVVIALAQLNRELEKRSDKRPKKSDLRDSGSIEQDADIIWLLYNKNENNSDETIVLGNIIDKFREGSQGEFFSNFHRPTRRIKEWKS